MVADADRGAGRLRVDEAMRGLDLTAQNEYPYATAGTFIGAASRPQRVEGHRRHDRPGVELEPLP